MSKGEVISSDSFRLLTVVLQKLGEKHRLSKKQIIEALSSEQIKKKDLWFSIDILLSEIEKEFSIPREELISILALEFLKDEKSEESSLNIPTTIFNRNVGSLESLVFYLHEDQHQSFPEIALLLKRKLTTVRTSYLKAVEKGQKNIDATEISIKIPAIIFSERKLTVFESATVFLKNKNFSFKEIAKLLGKDQRNVWSTYSRALTKLNKGGEKS